MYLRSQEYDDAEFNFRKFRIWTEVIGIFI